MQKFNLLSVVSIGFITLLTGCSAPDDKKADATANGAKEQTAPAKKTVVKSPPLTSPIHQVSMLDDKVQYAIDSLKTSKSLGEMKKGRTASEGNNFYIVSFRARNSGTEPVKIATEAMTVISVDNESTPPSLAGKEAVTLNGGSPELFDCTLEPGEAKPFLAIFDLPPSTINGGANFVIPSTKSGSNDRWVVRLDNSNRK